MASPRAKRLSFRTTGVIVAVGVFLIACGVLGLIAVWNRPAASGPAIAAKPVNMPAAPISLTEQGLQNAGRARVQFVAKDDPTRVIGFLEWASLEPTGPGRAVIDEPRAEVFLRDGSTVLVRAAKGTVAYPAGRPTAVESGTFEGGVTVELMGPGSDGQPGGGRPIARAFTSKLAFNGAMGELAADGPIRVSGEQFEFSGSGVRLIGNEVETRLELVEVAKTDYFWFSEKSARAARARNGPLGAPATGQADVAVPPIEPKGREVFYHAALAGNVQIVRRAMTLTASQFQAWAHLVDNALPTGALGPEGTSGAADGSDQRADAAPSRERPFTRTPPSRSAEIPGEPASLFAGLDDPSLVEATWRGPFTLAPVAGRPAQLENDEVAVTCDGGADGVTMLDSELGASATAPQRLEYGLTSGRLAIRGNATPATLALNGKGSIQVPEAWINIRSGEGGAKGESKLVAAESTEQTPRMITWKDAAEFAMTTRDGSIGDRLKSATFRGNVEAHEGAGLVRSDSAHAIFGGFERPQGPLEGQLVRIETRGNVVAHDGRDGRMTGDQMDLDFEPSPNGKAADPRRLEARGNVTAERDGWRITCASLDADLDRDERNDVVVTSAAAHGDTLVTGRGVEARADHIAADVQRQVIDLMGKDVRLSRDGGTIRGTQMRLEGLREELFVFGAGQLDVSRPAVDAADGHTHTVHAQWQKSMSFSNLDGKAECAGAVEVVSAPSPFEEETLRATRVLLTFTPGKGENSLATPADNSEADDSEPPTERRLLRAEAIGESDERQGGEKATIESKRFARDGVAADAGAAAGAAGPSGVDGPLAAGAQRAVERLIYAEGDRLIADQIEQSVTIPGAGRLLIDDRRAAGNATSAGGGPQDSPSAARTAIPADLSSARGTTLLRWQDQLRFTREDGKLAMQGAVRLIHRDSPEAQVLSIDAATATAHIRTPGSADSELLTPGKQAELVSASCDGSVVAQLGTDGRRLTTDKLTFNALTGVAEAAAIGDNRLTLSQPGSPTPVVARRLSWDTRKDQWRIVEPAPLVAPR